MDTPKSDVPKIPEMVMCGDHPSFTKTELNAKETKPEDKDKKKLTSYARITPSSSRTDRDQGASAEREQTRATSEHALRLLEARRRVRSLEAVQRADVDASAPGNRALVQAALGSFRWPPYLLAVWVIVLVLTHVLHCVVTMLERALPNIKRFCQYFRTWTEDTWKVESELNNRLYPVALALLTGLLYSLYCGLYVIYSVAVWSIEPLCSELEEKQSSLDVTEAKITNYLEEVSSKTNNGAKVS